MAYINLLSACGFPFKYSYVGKLIKSNYKRLTYKSDNDQSAQLAQER